MLVLIFTKTDVKGQLVFLSGFSAAAVQVVLWVVMQMLSGYVYGLMGASIVCFMAFLAVGALTGAQANRFAPRTKAMAALAITGCTAGAIALFVNFFAPAWTAIQGIWVVIPIGVTAFATGLLFETLSSGNRRNNRRLAGNLYSLDLLGGALGAFAFSIWIIPFWGLGHGTILIVVVLAAGLFLSVRIKPYQ
jgi:hypothetical protein